MGLDIMEDIFSAFPLQKKIMGCFVEELWQWGYPGQAKEIYLKYGLRGEADYVSNGLVEDLMEQEETVSLSSSHLMSYGYGPLSTPSDKYFQLPQETQVQFIGSEGQAKLLDSLRDEPFLAVDCEWRPGLSMYDKSPLALMQIGSSSKIFLIDLIALKDSQVLDQHLTAIFQSHESTIVGLGLDNDIQLMQQHLPSLNFYLNI
jgi:hypothetical protein